MAKNKVIYAGETLIDLTADTVTASTMLSGTTAHDRTGTQITGSVAFSSIYTGSTDPSSSVGVNGDIYLKVVS